MSATATANFTINPSTATGVVLNPLVNFSTLAAPVAAGTPLYATVISPSTWSGTLALGGTDAAKFAINSSNQLAVGASALAAGSYSVTVIANP